MNIEVNILKTHAQIAIAICCSSGGKVSIRMACEDEIIAAGNKQSHFGDVDPREADLA